MIGFFIKKAFFDGWDNLLGIIIHNIVYMLILTGFLGCMSLLETHLGLSLILMALILIISCILLGGTAEVVRGYSNYQKELWEPFAKGVKRNIGHSLVFAFVSLILSLVLVVAMPFYLTMGNIFGLIIGVVLFWLCVVAIFALPFYFPLMNLLPGDRPGKTLKKCFIIVSDNMVFSIFFFIYNLVIFAMSILTVGMIPGVVGYMLGAQDAMKLLMYKYDYLEENPDKKGHRVPWADLLYDEKEKIGPRSLKSMIFPWKY